MAIEYFAQLRPPTIEEVAKAHPDVIEDLRGLSPIVTAATFGSLLTVPELQANCFRIEVMVHLALAYCEGDRAPTEELVARQFERLGRGICGRMEDPAEDVFASRVSTGQGNFRILEGTHEGAGFYLQRMLGVMERAPERTPFVCMRRFIGAMLHAADLVTERAGVLENQLGGETPLQQIPATVLEKLSGAVAAIEFKNHDFAATGLESEALDEFIFDLRVRGNLRTASVNHSDLQRRPLVRRGGRIYFVLPTAAASAITRIVIESALSMGHAKAFESALAREYSEVLCGTRILGTRLGKKIEFRRLESGHFASMMTEVDAGRFLHLMIIVDGVAGFSRDGLDGMNADAERVSALIEEHIKTSSAEVKKQQGFRSGMSLITSCGFGRAFEIALKPTCPDSWRIQSIAAYDLLTVSWFPEFDALSLWRLLDQQEALYRAGVSLQNANGLPNLIAWVRQLDGHMVPHGQIPEEFGTDAAPAIVVLPSNAIRELRQHVLTVWDMRRVQDFDGRWVKVFKLDPSEFEEDHAAPLYGSEDDVRQKKLRAVYVTRSRPWWIGISTLEESPDEGVYEHWKMLGVWLKRAAPILDDAYANLPPGPLMIEVTFAEIVGLTRMPVKSPDLEGLRSLFRISAEVGSPQIGIQVERGFDDGLCRPENYAERTLIEKIVQAVAIVGGEALDKGKQESLVAIICPDTEARFMHRFEARSFRDHMRAEPPDDAILIDKMDDALSRIGLGWRVRAREAGSEITGVQECTEFLKQVVKTELDDLCMLLHGLDRTSFVTDVLLNHESAAMNRDNWKRTARASLGLHEDKEAAVRTIAEHQARLNAVFLATRVLLEAGICECPVMIFAIHPARPPVKQTFVELTICSPMRSPFKEESCSSI
jgi:hypothetical protein